MPELFFTAATVGSAVWLGLVLMTGAGFAVRDWRARNKLLRGERPSDGDLISVTGEIRPAFEALHAPLSGRACVLYDIGMGSRSTRDHLGFGMARCAVYTQYGSFSLGSFPAIEDFARLPADVARAAEYVASTTFEELDSVSTVASRAMQLYRETPPIRKDWRIGAPGGEIEQATESIIVPGEVVTVTGRYVSAQNEIVSDLKEKGYLRLKRGGAAMREEALPWRAIRSVLGGLAIVLIANALLWFVLMSSRA